MKKVLVVATSRKTRGGITSVIKAYETTTLWTNYKCKWIGTHIDRSKIIKILYYLRALFEFIVLAPFYDIVHFHISLQSTAIRKKWLMRIAKLYRKKTIIHLHCGNQIDDIWNADYDYLFSAADKCILLSHNLQKLVEKHTGQQNKYHVVYNPCLTEIQSQNILDKKKEILFAGTLYEGKGYRDLIIAFAKIARKHNDWSIVLAGNGEISIGKQIAKNLNIEDQIKFLGWISGKTKDTAFKEASIFCLPSYAEGFPMAVLDAFSYGLPIVTTPVGGIPDIAIDGKNMLLFNPGDTDKLAENLNRLIENSNLRDNLSIESQKLAKTTFNIDEITRNLSNIYNSI